jgi:CO dehydrogenase maturation factor
MSYRIAVAGKGGVGKTTIAALIVRQLIKNGRGPVLGVDADPNSNLAESFGIVVTKAIGTVLEDFIAKKADMPAGMTKESYLEMWLSNSLGEGKGADFLVMGRKQGTGCYCYPNALLKDFMDKLSDNYPYLVIDNEAGMEHLSRKNIDRIDLFILVSDYTLKGLRAAGRINELAAEIRLEVKNKMLIVNRCAANNGDALESAVKAIGIVPTFEILEDPGITEADVRGINFIDLPDDLPSIRKVDGILKNYIAV